MIDAAGNNLVFLLSTPRSGSSLATVMLQNHRRIFATQEMWFLMSLYDLPNPVRRAYGGTGILRQFYDGVLPRETFEGACRAFALQAYNGLLRSSGEADIAVDKSPRYYYLLEFLDVLFPAARRIWLVRNPLSVLSSYKKVSAERGDRFDLKEDLADPRFNIKTADLTVGLFRYFRYFTAESPYGYRLSYERLVADPAEQLAKVCGFLGVAYEEGMEKYGNRMDTAKSGLYFSMGVGDPNVARHSEPHTDSVNLWKDVLDKREVEMYCRTLGAGIFHELGYGEALAEAERWTGVRFGLAPDQELLQLRTRQLAEATGCKWVEDYRMQSGIGAKGRGLLDALPTEPAQESDSPQILQLQITLRALEKRLESSFEEQRRLRAQLESMKAKASRLKSMVPFGHRISNWASAYLTQGGWKK